MVYLEHWPRYSLPGALAGHNGVNVTTYVTFGTREYPNTHLHFRDSDSLVRNTSNGLRNKFLLISSFGGVASELDGENNSESRDVLNLRRRNRNSVPAIRNSTLAFEWDSLDWLNYFFHFMPMQLWWRCTQEFFQKHNYHTLIMLLLPLLVWFRFCHW